MSSFCRERGAPRKDLLPAAALPPLLLNISCRAGDSRKPGNPPLDQSDVQESRNGLSGTAPSLNPISRAAGLGLVKGAFISGDIPFASHTGVRGLLRKAKSLANLARNLTARPSRCLFRRASSSSSPVHLGHLQGEGRPLDLKSFWAQTGAVIRLDD